MTAAALVSAAEAAGLRLEPREGGILHVAPRERLTPALREALRAQKAEVLTILRQRQTQETLGVDWTRVSLWQLDRVLELAIPWADATLILVPGCPVAKALRERDPRPAYVWCVCEVLDPLLTGVGPEEARKIAEAKQMFSGTIGRARRLNP